MGIPRGALATKKPGVQLSVSVPLDGKHASKPTTSKEGRAHISPDICLAFFFNASKENLLPSPWFIYSFLPGLVHPERCAQNTDSGKQGGMRATEVDERPTHQFFAPYLQL